jgi:hypothetical protein
MTAKEKAEELIRRFYSIGAIECKQCALIAVDEIMHFMDVFNLDIEMKHQHKWWQKVKQEIEKL